MKNFFSRSNEKFLFLLIVAIEIFDEKRNISSPTTSNVQRPKSSLSEDISQSQHEKSERESETTSTRASSGKNQSIKRHANARSFFVRLETVTSDVSDLERRVHDYSEQLKAKKKELERLKRRNKELLRRQETELKRQIDVKTKRISSYFRSIRTFSLVL